MKRNVSLDEISDGKLYNEKDLVKVGCNGCKDCFACCQGMGNSIVLDPLDIYRLQINLNQTFEELLKNRMELNVVDGVILPNLKMNNKTEQCSFLNQDGRCSIHAFRPGICRLFPLGRYYENDSFQYFLQIYECHKPNKTKVKVSKWIDTPDLKKYEMFVTQWHYFLKDIEKEIESMGDDAKVRNINMYLLNHFYIKAYDKNIDFYLQFYQRLNEIKEAIQK